MSNHPASTLDETLRMFAKYEEHDEYHFDCDVTDGHPEFYETKAHQAIATALELIIGNNEPYTDITTANDAINEAILQRNVLRGEQRARAALFVEKGE